MKRSLLLPFLLGLTTLLSAQNDAINCDVLQQLPALRQNDFENTTSTAEINDNSALSDLALFPGQEALHIYTTPGGKKQLMSARLMFKDKEAAVTAYSKIHQEIVDCLGEDWTHSNEPYSGSARIRIFRGEFQHRDTEANPGIMLLHVRETLRSSEYYISFSYE